MFGHAISFTFFPHIIEQHTRHKKINKPKYVLYFIFFNVATISKCPGDHGGQRGGQVISLFYGQMGRDSQQEELKLN